MRVVRASVCVLGLFGCTTAVLDESALPAAITNAQYALEACHSRILTGEFQGPRPYALCRLAAERQAVNAVKLTRPDIFEAHERRMMALVEMTEAGPQTFEAGKVAGDKMIEYTIALYNTIIDTHAVTEQRRAEERAFLQAYILARASATRININQ